LLWATFGCCQMYWLLVFTRDSTVLSGYYLRQSRLIVWYSTQKNQDRIMGSSLWGSNNTVFFWHQQWLGRLPLPSKICTQSGPLPLKSSAKRWLWPISAYNVSTKKSSIITNRKSTTFFPTSYKWSMYVTPNSPEGGSKSEFVVLWIKINLNRINSATKFLCLWSCSRTIPLSNGV